MTDRGRKKLSGVISLAIMAFVLNGCQESLGMALDQVHTQMPGETETTGITDFLKTRGMISEEIQIQEDTIYLNVAETGKIIIKSGNEMIHLHRILFVSSNEEVCKVMRDGTIVGMRPGTAEVILKDRFSDWKEVVTVWIDEDTVPREIILPSEEISLTAGERTIIQAVVVPEQAEESPLIWNSSDETVAMVSREGEINAVANGECRITAVLRKDSMVRAELRVRVMNPDISVGNWPSTNGAIDVSENNTSNTGGKDSSESTSINQDSWEKENNDSSMENTDEEDTKSVHSAYYVEDYAKQVLDIVNARRLEAGLAPLVMNDALVSAARVRALEIIQNFSHTRPDGTGCFTALDESGVSYLGAGENLAAGQWSPDSAMNSWMNSAGHRDNILNGNFTQIGIACYYDKDSPYGYYWVQCFIN